MTFLFAFLFMSQIQKALLFDKIVPVEAAKVVRMPFEIANPQTTVNLSFDVEEKNGHVKVVVRKAGEGTILGETGFDSSGTIKVHLADTNKIWIDVDNRASRLSPANVAITIKTSWKVELPVEARELPNAKKLQVVLASLCFLLGIVSFSAWKLIPIWISRSRLG